MIKKYAIVKFEDRTIEHREADFNDLASFLVKLNEWNSRASGLYQYWSEDQILEKELKGERR